MTTAHIILDVEIVNLLDIPLRRLLELPVLVPVHCLPFLWTSLHYNLLYLDRSLLTFTNCLINYQLFTKFLLVEFIIRLAPDQCLTDILAIVSW
jgi:hypothetical protein